MNTVVAAIRWGRSDRRPGWRHKIRTQHMAEMQLPLVPDNFALLLQRAELPLHEGVIVLVDVSGDEGAAPVNATAHGCHVTHCQGWEVAQPMHAVPASDHDNLTVEHSVQEHDMLYAEISDSICRASGVP